MSGCLAWQEEEEGKRGQERSQTSKAPQPWSTHEVRRDAWDCCACAPPTPRGRREHMSQFLILNLRGITVHSSWLDLDYFIIRITHGYAVIGACAVSSSVPAPTVVKHTRLSCLWFHFHRLGPVMSAASIYRVAMIEIGVLLGCIRLARSNAYQLILYSNVHIYG
jgi:hypothetical protein